MGYLHVYTGEGKGKTSAAYGAAFRVFGLGHQVFIAQFLKHKPSGEVLAWGKTCSRPVALLGAQRKVSAPFTESDIAIIVTGRYAPRAWLEEADLVTEFRCVKHYATTGVPPRRGIEF